MVGTRVDAEWDGPGVGDAEVAADARALYLNPRIESVSGQQRRDEISILTANNQARNSTLHAPRRTVRGQR